ncbi:MAG: hypothetical protein IJT26_07310 [Bacteroidales bacterium]|nr:hypothetical protein [Bacteroidales bacterium]
MKKYRWIILLVTMAAAIAAAGYIPETQKIETAQMTTSNVGYLVSCAVAFSLFCVVFCLALLGGRLQMRPLLSLFLWMALAVLILVGVAVLIIRLTAGVISWLWGIGAPVVVIALFLWLYFRYRKISGDKAAETSVRKSASGAGEIRFSFRVLFASMGILLLTGIIALIVGQPSHYLFVPLSFATLAILLWRLLKWRGFMLIGALTIVLYVLRYCVPDQISFTAGNYWPSLALTLLYLGLVVPLSDLYCRKESSI